MTFFFFLRNRSADSFRRRRGVRRRVSLHRRPQRAVRGRPGVQQHSLRAGHRGVCHWVRLHGQDRHRRDTGLCSQCYRGKRLVAFFISFEVFVFHFYFSLPAILTTACSRRVAKTKHPSTGSGGVPALYTRTASVFTGPDPTEPETGRQPARGSITGLSR